MAMVCADFSGGEAEELRRAFGFKRSEARMKEIEVKLRRGMERNGISRKAQDEIVLAITSFALYGFPESHAASFALIAYASAYLKCHYLAAFTAAILNNQPMGFYQPFTIVKDAQRHGLKVLPVDVMQSDWLCTIETSPKSKVQSLKSKTDDELYTEDLNRLDHSNNDNQTLDFGLSTLDSDLAMRLGLKYVKGLREESGQAIVRARAEAPFMSIDDLHQRVPQLRKHELRKLAAVGALNFIKKSPKSKVQTRSRMSNVQCPMSASPNSPDQDSHDYLDQTGDNRQTLDIGHWTLDKSPLTLNVGRR